MSPDTKSELKKHIDAGFTDKQCAESMNLGGFLTAHGNPFSSSAIAYYRSVMGIKKLGGVLKKRRRGRNATEANAAPMMKTSTSRSLKGACVALLDCAPAQRAERIELVFKLLGVK